VKRVPGVYAQKTILSAIVMCDRVRLFGSTLVMETNLLLTFGYGLQTPRHPRRRMRTPQVNASLGWITVVE